MKINHDHEYVEDLIIRARRAQRIAETYSQEKVDRLVKAVAWEAVKEENAREIARIAYEESKLGYLEAKYIKIVKKVRGALRDIKDEKSVGVIEYNNEKGLIKIAKPAGVIGALVPCTNPEATPVMKALFALKGRNAIIISPHPRTKKTNKCIVELMRKALKKQNAPEDLIIGIEDVTIEKSKQLMESCDLIVATGGSNMVKAAYSSGTPAYGVGTGNAVAVVDETAEPDDAANKIMKSKTFDYATSCSADNAVVVQEEIYKNLVDALIKEGGYLVNNEEKLKLMKKMWTDCNLNKNIIGRPALEIAEAAGFNIGNDRKFIIVPETGIGMEYPFSGEKLSVVIAIYKYADFEEAIDKVNKITGYMGQGHSCSIHSFDEDHIKKFYTKTKTSRLMVRQATSAANSGNWNNGMPFTLTLGCGTWGGNISSENITWKHMINTTWVSYPIKESVPDDNDLFGDIMYE